MADPLSVFLVITRHETATFKVKGRKLGTTDALGTSYASATIDELLELGDEDLGGWVRRQIAEARQQIEEAGS